MIDCKKYADEILYSITGHGHLAVISVGNDPASMSYIKGKKKDCDRVGFGFTHKTFPEDAKKEEIITAIERFNNDPEVTGVIVQLPLPSHLDSDEICSHVAIEKDVDGFLPSSPFKPCTPEGIVYLLKKELGDLAGKSVVIVGRGKLVGKPLMQMLLDENMTVSICHSKTRYLDIVSLVRLCDAAVLAVGKPEFLHFYDVHPETIIVDCGVNRNKNGKLCGDAAADSVERQTPVPGGVGLLTRAMLMKHVERKG